MKNPFDRTFFRLLLGFVFILSIALAMLVFVKGDSLNNLGGATKTEAIKTSVPVK